MGLLYVLVWKAPASREALIRALSEAQAIQQARLILKREGAISGDLYAFDDTREPPLELKRRGIESLS